MRKYRILILSVAVVLAALAAYGVFTAPELNLPIQTIFPLNEWLLTSRLSAVNPIPSSILWRGLRSEITYMIG